MFVPFFSNVGELTHRSRGTVTPKFWSSALDCFITFCCLSWSQERFKMMFIFIFQFFFSIFGSLEVAGGESFFNNSQSFPLKNCSPDLKQLRCFGMKSQFPGMLSMLHLSGWNQRLPGLEVNQVCHGWFSRWPRRSLAFFLEAVDNFPTCSRWFSHSQIPDRWKRKLKSRVLNFIKQALVEKTKIWN